MSGDGAAARAVSAGPRSLGLHITRRCPLRCATCCFSAGPERAGSMSLERILDCVRQASTVPSIEEVVFTGEGEPMLLRGELLEAVRLAARFGLRASVVTGGHWGADAKTAGARLDELAAAGLARLVLSFDDAHAEFVSVEGARRILEGALARGIASAAVAMVIDRHSRWTPERLALALGPELSRRLEFRVGQTNPAGRAGALPSESWLPDSSPYFLKPDRPCGEALENLSVGVEGDLFVCCATLDERSFLRVGNVFEEPLAALLARAAQDPVWRWMAEEGPCVIARALAADGAAVPERRWASICDACRSVAGDPALAPKVAELARRRETFAAA